MCREGKCGALGVVVLKGEEGGIKLRTACWAQINSVHSKEPDAN